MTVFTNRTVLSVDLPLAEETRMLRPEQAIIVFSNNVTVDIGELCYLNREAVAGTEIKIRRRGQGGKVAIDTLCPDRIRRIKNLIKYLSDRLRYGKGRSSSLVLQVRLFKTFLNWADNTDNSAILLDESSLRRGVAAYAAHVWERVRNHEITQNTGARMQKDTFNFLVEFMGVPGVTRGIKLLKRDANSVESTMPPSEADQGRVLRLCEALFNGLSSRIMERAHYPFSVSMPTDLEYLHNEMWIFPVPVWCLPAERIHVPGSHHSGYFFDYATGALRTKDEVRTMLAQSGEMVTGAKARKKLNRAAAKSHSLIKTANSNLLHRHRAQLGILALNCFIRLFLSRTGMNWEIARSLEWKWSCKEAVSTIRQRFRDIKFRAGGKIVNFQLPLEFMPCFRKYLEFRAHLLNDYPDFEFLIFSFGANATGGPRQLKTGLQISYRALERIDPSLEPILSREWRAAKSNWSLNKYDVPTTAALLQNSESTVKRSYAAGSADTHYSEMTEMLEKLVAVTERDATECSVAAGACKSYGNPQTVVKINMIAPQPDCDNPEIGCLYCDKFKVHADETDVRKLLSCRFCLSRTSSLAGLYVQSTSIISKIDKILGQIKELNSGLVDTISEQVDAGELDPYWAKKFDLLLRLGLISDY